MASSTQPGSASVTGTIAGQPVQGRNAVSTLLTTPANGQTITSWTVDVTTYANACGCNGGANVQSLSFSVGTVDSTIPTGTYSFGADAGSNPAGATAAAHYYFSGTATLLTATSGSIDLSAIDSSAIAGSFDLSFPSGDHVTGTFTAPVCTITTPAPDAGACQ